MHGILPPCAKRLGSDAPAELRRGFTLVELLVVITIIGILVSMLLPAVNQVREAGRQAQCKNNLRQLGVAMDAYHTKAGSLPMGAWYNGVTEGKTWHLTEYGWTALVYALPYIEQQSVYGAFDLKPKNTRDSQSYPYVPGSNPRISTLSFRIPTFVCPSDSARGIRPGTTYALSNYVASAGATQVSTTGDTSRPCTCNQPYNVFYPKLPSPRFPGPFRVHNFPQADRRPAITYAMIRDGQSNTIMMGEVRQGCNPHIEGGWVSSTNGCAIISTMIPINYDTCQGVDACSSDGCKSEYNYSTSIGFKAAHPGGVNFVMCDGSVHFFSESIDHQTYQYLGACDDGRPAVPPP
jgi:prepilin-type N-terminal cleavage/methylation domain-containing protein/prepilin-type processing-associated H-X9-DG protein